MIHHIPVCLQIAGVGSWEHPSPPRSRGKRPAAGVAVQLPAASSFPPFPSPPPLSFSFFLPPPFLPPPSSLPFSSLPPLPCPPSPFPLLSPLSAPSGARFSVGSFGHTGLTGTSVWTDPYRQVFVTLFPNRVHPEVGGSVTSLRKKVASVLAASIMDASIVREHLYSRD